MGGCRLIWTTQYVIILVAASFAFFVIGYQRGYIKAFERYLAEEVYKATNEDERLKQEVQDLKEKNIDQYANEKP